MGNGYFDDVPVDRISACETAMVAYLRSHPTRVLDRLGDELAITDPILADLKTGVAAFKAQWSSEGKAK